MSILDFSRALIEAFIDDAATHKTIDSFVTRMNRTFQYSAQQRKVQPPRLLDVNSFRQAFFLCMAFECSIKLECPTPNTLLFTRANMGGAGPFEEFLEDLTGPLSDAFTGKWVTHSTTQCGISHQALIGDGHAKLNFRCCSSKNGTRI